MAIETWCAACKPSGVRCADCEKRRIRVNAARCQKYQQDKLDPKKLEAHRLACRASMKRKRRARKAAGLTSAGKPFTRKACRWTEEMDEMLFDYYGFYKSGDIAAKLNRKFGTELSWNAVRIRASMLGIAATTNQGYFTVAEAARMIGMSKGGLLLHHKSRGEMPKKRSRLFRYLTAEEVEVLRQRFAPPPVPTVLTQVAADRLFVTRKAIHELIRRGKLLSYRVGRNRFIDAADLARLAAERGLA